MGEAYPIYGNLFSDDNSCGPDLAVGVGHAHYRGSAGSRLGNLIARIVEVFLLAHVGAEDEADAAAGEGDGTEGLYLQVFVKRTLGAYTLAGILHALERILAHGGRHDRLEGHLAQRRAACESTSADLGHILADGDFGQLAAVFECGCTDCLEGVGEFDSIQGGAAEGCLVADSGDAGGKCGTIATAAV